MAVLLQLLVVIISLRMIISYLWRHTFETWSYLPIVRVAPSSPLERVEKLEMATL